VICSVDLLIVDSLECCLTDLLQLFMKMEVCDWDVLSRQLEGSVDSKCLSSSRVAASDLHAMIVESNWEA